MSINTHERRPIYADGLVFFDLQGMQPVAGDLIGKLTVASVTAAPPFFEDPRHVLDGVQRPDGTKMPGVRGFRQVIEGQSALKVVHNKGDLSEVVSSGDRTGVILSLQNTPYGLTESDLSQLFEEGVRAVALEYKNPRGFYGSGWLNPEGRLTRQGKKLLKMLSGSGMVLDLSHSGHQTATDALNHLDKRGLDVSVMASHGGINERYSGKKTDKNNGRNLKLEHLNRIAEMGGLVGIYALTFGLADTDNSSTVFYEQLREASQRWPNSVMVGSDAVYKNVDNETRRQHYEKFMVPLIAMGTDMEPRFPDLIPAFNTESIMPSIESELLRIGVARQQVDAVIGGNFVRFFSEVLPD